MMSRKRSRISPHGSDDSTIFVVMASEARHAHQVFMLGSRHPGCTPSSHQPPCFSLTSSLPPTFFWHASSRRGQANVLCLTLPEQHLPISQNACPGTVLEHSGLGGQRPWKGLLRRRILPPCFNGKERQTSEGRWHVGGLPWKALKGQRQGTCLCGGLLPAFHKASSFCFPLSPVIIFRTLFANKVANFGHGMAGAQEMQQASAAHTWRDSRKIFLPSFKCRGPGAALHGHYRGISAMAWPVRSFPKAILFN